MRKKGVFGDKNFEAKTKLENVLVKKDIFNPEKERVIIFFKEGNSSGIINLNNEEADSLFQSLKQNKEIIKKTKKI